MTWKFYRGAFDLGYLPMIFLASDPRPAREQANDRYRHGGGWQPFQGHRFDARRRQLCYPGDPPMRALAETKLRDETIILFEADWVMILQPDGSHEIARMD